MKKIFGSVINVRLMLAVLVGLLNTGLYGQPVQDPGNKQYVQVILKDGKVINFEYRSFIEMNLKLQPVTPADASGMKSSENFGEKRVLFREKDNCEEHSISLDNLQEIELLGIVEDKCSQTKEWLFKVYLLDLDKYEGFFLKGEDNLKKVLSEQDMRGQVLNTTDSSSLRFEDIKKITFFAR
ncbi:MAG TPA: hypothetical protein VK186_12665 [Candidatus Deferrimicrobium sp.]|nr:hypothetical protein [Candidatus Deferrimicrobium sp.]